MSVAAPDLIVLSPDQLCRRADHGRRWTTSATRRSRWNGARTSAVWQTAAKSAAPTDQAPLPAAVTSVESWHTE